MALPEVGVQVVAKGAETAQKQLAAFNRSVASTQSAVQKAATKSGQLDTAAAGTAQSVGGLGGAFSALAGPVGIAITALNQGLEILNKVVATAKQAIATFIQLGRQAIQIESIGKAFGNIFAGVGTGDEALQKLRAQVRGTVSDVELMRLAVAGLQGTDQEFRRIVGQSFGEIIDATNRVADATGQNAEVVREKFLLGLRRQSKLLLDDVGVMVKAEDAYKTYAKEIGKSADALTDLEKRAAFAQAALKQLNDISAGLGERNVISDSLNQATAAIQNMKNVLVTSLKPIFAAVFGVAADVLTTFKYALTSVAPLLREIAGAVGGVLRGAFDGLKEALAPLEPLWLNMIVVLPYIAALVRLLGQAFASLAKMIVKGLIKPFTAVFGNLNKISEENFQQLAFRFARGAGRIVGAFAKGLADGAKYVIQAVTFIAQIVADFLEGFSPPKKGPLHDIDKGATRVAEAWADGFAMMDLEPVDNVLAQVNQRLGDIGTFTREQVTARLEALDLAIRPFVEQLDIVKSDFEAIAGFADPALKAIDRQRSRLLQLAGKGSFIDINRLRSLDRQSDMLSEIRDTSQDAVDNAEIQLALASAQQAQERALLNIQQRRLGEAEKIAAETGTGTTATPPTPGGGETSAEDNAINELLTGQAPNLIDTGAVDAALATIEAGFNKGLAESGAIQAIAGATAQIGLLNKQVARIKKADPVDKLTKKFEGLKEKLSKPFMDAQILIDEVLNNLGLGFDALGLVLDGLTLRFSMGLPSALTVFKGGVDVGIIPSLTAIGTTITNTVIPKLTALANQLGLTLPLSMGLFKTGLLTNVLPSLTAIGTTITNIVIPKLTSLGNQFGFALPLSMSLFNTGLITNVQDGIITLISWIESYLFPDLTTFKNWFSIDLPFAFDDFLASLILNVSDPLLELEKTVSDKVEQSFRRLVQFITSSFTPVMQKLDLLVITPIKNAFDTLAGTIGKVKDAIHDLGSAFLSLPGKIVDELWPGSPTPFEMGLRGITESMQELRQMGLKPLRMEFAKLPTPEMIMPSSSVQYGYTGGGAPGNTSIDNSRNANLGGVTIQVADEKQALWVQRQLLAQYGV